MPDLPLLNKIASFPSARLPMGHRLPSYQSEPCRSQSNPTGSRSLAENLILLTDRFEVDPFSSRRGVRTVKEKLVHLYPDQWSWTSTHVSGPARYSQFLYELVPRGSAASTLHFTGSQVERTTRPVTRSSIDQRTRRLRREDSKLWARFAIEIARDLA